MHFATFTDGGDDVGVRWLTLEGAVAFCKRLLDDDPETYQSLEVWEIEGAWEKHVKTVQTGPDDHWDTVIHVLDPGQSVPYPHGGIVVAIREDGAYRMEADEDAYDPTDPKHPRHHSTHADIWDMREGK